MQPQDIYSCCTVILCQLLGIVGAISLSSVETNIKVEHKIMIFFLSISYDIFRDHSGRVLDSRPRDRGFEPHLRHCVVSLSKIHSSLLVLPRKTRPDITDKLLTGTFVLGHSQHMI